MSLFVVVLVEITYPLEVRKLSGTIPQLNGQVYVLAGDRQRSWEGMIRREVFKQVTKFTGTYFLETDEDDRMG